MNIQYYSENEGNVELNASITCVAEMLEREIEKDRYRSFFHGNNNCSLRLNWYSGTVSHGAPISSPTSSGTLKRKMSVKAIVSGEEESASKRVATLEEKTLPSERHGKRRNAVLTDSEDGNDAEYMVSESSSSESKKPKKPEIKVRISDSRTKSEPKPVIKVKSSVAELQPKVSLKVSFSSPVATPDIGSEVVSTPEATPNTHASVEKSHSAEENLSVSGSETASVNWQETPEKVPKSRVQGAVEPAVRAKMADITQRLLSDPANELFLDPVPRVCEDYYLLIENPICLRDIRRKVDGSRYKSVQGFRRDLLLIVTNCVYYNMLMNTDQISNRKQAYALHMTILDSLRDLTGEQCSRDQLHSLATVYHTIIEKVYSIENKNVQLIRYFAIDNKRLIDYDRYVKKAILLRTILVRASPASHVDTHDQSRLRVPREALQRVHAPLRQLHHLLARLLPQQGRRLHLRRRNAQDARREHSQQGQ